MVFLKANEERYFFEVKGSPDEFRLVRMEGRERLSGSFFFRIETVAEYPDIELTPMLGQAGLITLIDQTNEESEQLRYIHGIVTSVELGDCALDQTTYYFEIEPKTALLDMRAGCRIFQQQDLQQIISTLLDEAGFSSDEYRFSLQESHPPRDYCVQYNETELAFIQRLLEEEGVHYYFEHQESVHCIVFSDTSSIHPTIEGNPVIPYFHDGQGAVREQHIHRFDYSEEVVSGQSRIRDYDFTRPRLKLESSQQAQLDQALEIYNYPGRFEHSDVGDQFAKVILESVNCQRIQTIAESDVNRMTPGATYRLKEHDRSALNDEYYITQVEHKCSQPQVLEQGATTEGSEYSNRVTAIPFVVPYRAPLTTPTPKIWGCQTALVCGPEGEEIYTDQHGRIKVQFHWDRIGQRDEQSSCWIRVSQLSAGKQYGSMFIPRIGEEVVVHFLEANPDRPMVTGRLYHGLNRAPYPLPGNKTKSTIKTNSSKGGGGFNEIRIEDKKGAEQLFTHAEKDLEQMTHHDHKEWVGNEHHRILEANEYREIRGDEHVKTQGRYRHQVQGDLHLTIGQDHQINVSSNQYLYAGDQLHFTSGVKQAMEAGVQIAFKAGGSFVKIDPGGVSFQGAQTKLNAGGGGGSGTQAAPVAPMNPAEPEAPPMPITPAQLATMTTPAPFCEECEACKDGSCAI